MNTIFALSPKKERKENRKVGSVKKSGDSSKFKEEKLFYVRILFDYYALNFSNMPKFNLCRKVS